MIEGDRRMKELERECEALRKELDALREREKDLEETRKAMLYMLEDLNETAGALAASKSEWEATFDNIQDLLFIHDSESRILKCNMAFQAAVGLTFKEVIGKRFQEVFPPCESGPCDEVDECETTFDNKVLRVKVFKFTRGGGEKFHIHVMEDITEARKKEKRENVLHQFMEKMASNLDFSYRLNIICEAAVDFGFRMAWAGVLKEDTKEIVALARAGFEDGYLSNISEKYDDSALGKGPVGAAVKNKKPQVWNRLYLNDEFKPWLEQARKRGYSSMAAVPVIDFEGKINAVLCVYSEKEEMAGDDVEFLVRFAAQAAVYLKNARLYQEVKDSSERIRAEVELTRNLLTIAQATAHSTNIQRLMDHVAHTVKDIMGCSVCLAYLWEKDKSSLHPCSSSGLSHEMLPFFGVERLDIENRAVLDAFDSKSPVLSFYGPSKKTPGADGNPFAWVEGVRTLLSIPLSGREGVLGIIFCAYTWDAKRFAGGLGDRDRLILQGISSQVSVAIEEARLFKESMDRAMDLSRKIETIEVMNEIDRTILSTLEPQEMLENGARMIGKILPCDRATIGLLDKEKRQITYAAGFGVASMAKGTSVPLEVTSVKEIFKTGRPQFVANLREEKELKPMDMKLLEEGFLSHIRVPLMIKGDIAGVLAIGSRRAAAYTSDDLSTMEKLAAQISVALENSKLLSDLEDLFMGIVRSLSEAIDAKSPWTRGHSERVTETALGIGREIGLSEKDLRSLELAGLLHDIGKLGTYEQILDKPGKLTPSEMEIIKLHPNKGAEILMPIRQMSDIIPIIRHHHEFYDGSGYPDGLKSSEIPLMSRILTVADTVDAMGADRPYRKGKPEAEILKELRRCSGTQFDPEVVNVYLRIAERSMTR